MALLAKYTPQGALQNDNAYHLIGAMHVNYVAETVVVHLAVNASAEDRSKFKSIKTRQEDIRIAIKEATERYGGILQKYGEASDEVLAAKKELSDTIFPLQKEMRSNKAMLEGLAPAIRPQTVNITSADFAKVIDSNGDVTRALVYQYIVANAMRSATSA